MGQQQLLLLVLSTVIVGLATVAGIQAFSENQQQAEEDALVQRAINIGNDVLAAHNEPTALGGVNLAKTSSPPSKSDVAKAAGYSSNSISADGVGNNALCTISSLTTGSNPQAKVKCGSSQSGSSPSGTTVTVLVDPDASSPVTVDSQP